MGKQGDPDYFVEDPEYFIPDGGDIAGPGSWTAPPKPSQSPDAITQALHSLFRGDAGQTLADAQYERDTNPEAAALSRNATFAKNAAFGVPPWLAGLFLSAKERFNGTNKPDESFLSSVKRNRDYVFDNLTEAQSKSPAVAKVDSPIVAAVANPSPLPGGGLGKNMLKGGVESGLATLASERDPSVMDVLKSAALGAGIQGVFGAKRGADDLVRAGDVDAARLKAYGLGDRTDLLEEYPGLDKTAQELKSLDALKVFQTPKARAEAIAPKVESSGRMLGKMEDTADAFGAQPDPLRALGNMQSRSAGISGNLGTSPAVANEGQRIVEKAASRYGVDPAKLHRYGPGEYDLSPPTDTVRGMMGNKRELDPLIDYAAGQGQLGAGDKQLLGFRNDFRDEGKRAMEQVLSPEHMADYADESARYAVRARAQGAAEAASRGVGREGAERMVKAKGAVGGLVNSFLPEAAEGATRARVMLADSSWFREGPFAETLRKAAEKGRLHLILTHSELLQSNPDYAAQYRQYQGDK